MGEYDRLPEIVVQAILDVTDRHDGYSLLTPLIEELGQTRTGTTQKNRATD